jgi:hypothetical protein
MNDEMRKPPPLDAFDFDTRVEEGVEGGDAQLASAPRVIEGGRLSFSNDFVWLLGGVEEFPKTANSSSSIPFAWCKNGSTRCRLGTSLSSRGRSGRTSM